MFSLRLASYLLAAPTLMGIFVIAFLTMDMVSARYIIIAAAAGAVVGIPVALMIASRISHLLDNKGTS